MCAATSVVSIGHHEHVAARGQPGQEPGAKVEGLVVGMCDDQERVDLMDHGPFVADLSSSPVGSRPENFALAEIAK